MYVSTKNGTNEYLVCRMLRTNLFSVYFADGIRSCQFRHRGSGCRPSRHNTRIHALGDWNGAFVRVERFVTLSGVRISAPQIAPHRALGSHPLNANKALVAGRPRCSSG